MQNHKSLLSSKLKSSIGLLNFTVMSSFFVACLTSMMIFFTSTRAHAGEDDPLTDPMLAPQAVALLGTDFKGVDRFRELFPERQQVAFVYPVESKRNRLTATFDLGDGGFEKVYIYVNGRYYRSEGRPIIKFSLDGNAFYEGSNLFEGDDWAWETFKVKSDGSKQSHKLVIENLQEKGLFGTADSFQVSEVVISNTPIDPKNNSLSVDGLVQFGFDLDAGENAVIPTPLSEGYEPGFAYRGLKGWNFDGQDYLDLIPFMVENKMNFLMNCYLSAFTRTERMETFENCLVPFDNDWWAPFSEEKKAELAAVIQACQDNGIIFCFSMNPNYHSTRPFDYNNEEDFQALAEHYLWAQSQGVKWFNVSFDDIKTGIDAEGQARSVGRLLDMLRKNDPDAEMVFCPTWYRITPKNKEKEIEYLIELSKYLPEDTYVFWTGSGRNRNVTSAEAKEYASYVKRPLIFWDNYPVNNGSNTLSLGPVAGRDAEMAEVVVGYMANPMWPEVHLNKLPLLTAADWAWNPYDYDPRRSIAAAIDQLTNSEEAAQALQWLVELYPGKIMNNRETGYNPFVGNFNKILELDHSMYIARAFIEHGETVLSASETYLTDPMFQEAIQRLSEDMTAIRYSYARHYGLNPDS